MGRLSEAFTAAGAQLATKTIVYDEQMLQSQTSTWHQEKTGLETNLDEHMKKEYLA